MPNRHERLVYIFAVPGWALLAAALGSSFYMIAHRPTAPDASLGYVYAIAAHGPPVYVSFTDLLIMGAPLALAVVSLAVGYYFQSRPR